MEGTRKKREERRKQINGEYKKIKWGREMKVKSKGQKEKAKKRCNEKSGGKRGKWKRGEK